MVWTKNFTKLSNDEILKVYKARTDPATLKFSNTNFSFDEHINFIFSLKFAKDKVYFMVYKDDEFIGVISFTNIIGDMAEFGVYKCPSVSNVGDILMKELIKEAKNLNIKTILARVFKENKKALYLYHKFGFMTMIEDDKIAHLKLNLE
ncbi:GNAT family N-acetyltransferase [Campylobacter hyointestinalis]|uniref:GNAT family N-acetyltransferase n=1 Tax=Campylobacter hyointestinalis subsp. lawsonii TaxID=91353 RepID=A0AAV6EC34_CAMHY|nr:GNAT family N-acetyltransferase [Campylobacter hyointestinalis]KAB0611371.1 GNAT family N-acetyltransferase [Campylobacter hyointestinalis subsp. lawsonii]QKF68822.1 acetyltransferase [Campylobacter hyointestinalis subsp. lawsonii]RAZ22402.1 UDP-4-amino-4,6-dideoxy-N-acetyl-beta-L-altrosamine N-acetyltransferase [Campylobacter hyointestinalis subsp. lawsonii]RAZ27114.1 UDP-4-amino-4,6-dideoxy-N-acetyl-beta-L-altrosamine N-acetyltransferase [Campylobacter hyointestinalis subsp. lawsonii]RAZ3